MKKALNRIILIMLIFMLVTNSIPLKTIDISINANAAELKSVEKYSGNLDVVFVVDTTGSMSSVISNVKKNLKSFSNTLFKNYGIHPNYALIEFRDITTDGLQSTKIIKNGTSNWYTDPDEFENAISNLSISGGGDELETPIDALEMSRRLDWSFLRAKHVILITDTGYKTNNNYGVYSMSEEIESLKNDKIVVSVISSPSYKSEYTDLFSKTGGVFGSINDSFGQLLLDLACFIGENSIQIHTVENYQEKNSSYADTYYSGSAIPMDGTNSTPDMCIPELSESYGMIPQGIGFSENLNSVLISSYYKKSKKDEGQKEHPSKIFTLDFDTGVLKNEYSIKYKSTGNYSYGHVGGVASYGENIYVTNGSNINLITNLDEATAVAEVTKIYDLSGVMNGAKCSYLSVTDGVLWTGNFYKAKNDSYNTIANPDENINSVVLGYKLNEDGTFNHLNPTYRINVSNSINSVQGATVKDGVLYLNTSYGKCNPGRLYHFDVSLNAIGSEVSNETSCQSLPMSQGMFIHDGYMYVLSESAAHYYLDTFTWKDKSATDVVWRIDYNFLNGVNTYPTTDGDTIDETVTFNDGGKNGTTTFSFKQSWLGKDSAIYNHYLGQLCSQFVMMGYDCVLDTELTTDHKKVYKKPNLKNALVKMGMDESTIRIEANAGQEEMNYFLANRKVNVNGKEYTLIFTGYIGSFQKQWLSNFDPGTGETHKGFNNAKEYVYDIFEAYIQEIGATKDNTKILIAGHSRGAATANLVAAQLIKDEKYASKENIYTYAFATPNSTRSSEKNEARFKRIFNVVNPEDFVTKCIPAAWGYGRYGTTYTLPSVSNSVNYIPYLSAMRPYFTEFFGGEIYVPFDMGEFATYTVVKELTDSIKSIEGLYEKKYKWLGEKNVSVQEYFSQSLCSYLAAEKDSEEQKKAKDLLIDTYTTGRTVFSTSGILVAINDYFIDYEGISQVPVIGASSETYFTYAHCAPTYCAFMMSMTESQICTYRSALHNSVNCPVDVEIYDKITGELVGKIVNNVVDEEVAAKENAVTIVVDGDSKQFWLPSDGYYDVILTGNDEGTMDYTVEEIDSDGGEMKRSNFFGVDISEGLQMSGIPEVEEASLNDYELNLEDGSTLGATVIMDSDYENQLLLDTQAYGKGVATESVYATSGDYVTISAESFDDAEFYGWYVNDELVSSEKTFSFVLKDDLDVEAEFSRDLGDSNGDNRINSVDALNALKYTTDIVQFNQFENSATDVNADGDIDSLDALMILQHSVGIITEFKPIEE